VEVNRISLAIEETGLESVNLSEFEYVKQVTTCAEDATAFYHVDSDYMIREIHGVLYRFDYTENGQADKLDFLWLVNGVLLAMTIVIMAVLLFVRQRILSPFQRLSDVPYELAKGNLSAPLKENKNRFFGRFVWGVDLLRENMEQARQRELELQKSKKTLLLSLSHDIKTPLSAIKLYSQALSKGLYSEMDKQKEIAENINRKADEIEGYVSQIISASKEDFLELDVKPEWVGKSLQELDLRKKYSINVVAVLQGADVSVNVEPDKPLEETMKLIVIANVSKLKKLK